MVSGIEQIIDPAWMGVTWMVTLTHADAVGWDRERLDMLLDGLWLVDQAMGGERTEGVAPAYRAACEDLMAFNITESRLAAEMAEAGIEGYVLEVKGEFYIPVIIATNPGRGDCSRWLDSLPRDRTIKVPGVINRRLAGMLERRGFVVEREWADEFQEMVDVHVRRAGGDVRL